MLKKYLIYIISILLSLGFSKVSFAWASFSYEDGDFKLVVTNKTKQEPLHRELLEASYTGDRLAVERALNLGANINAQNYMGDTALILAIRGGGHVDIVKFLLEKKADVHIRGYADGDALAQAVVRGYKEITEMLLAEGADVNAIYNQGGVRETTLLFYAIVTGNKEITEMLLAEGVDEVYTGLFSETPLELALRKGQIEIAQLIEAKENNLKKMGPDHP